MTNLSPMARNAQERVSGIIRTLAVMHGVPAPIVRTQVGGSDTAYASFFAPQYAKDGTPIVSVPTVVVYRVRRACAEDLERTACHEFLHYMDWRNGSRRNDHGGTFYAEVEQPIRAHRVKCVGRAA